jgi:NAD(P)-dependent dehydrogenase (short-subunit alcohol dehydrogenase family)
VKKVALITGVTSGIGKATAERFSKEGWCVIGVDREPAGDRPDLDHFIRMDVSAKDSPKRVIKEIQKRQGRLDALVNNAAVQICKPLVETTADEWELTMAVNARSPFLFVIAAHPLLKQTKGSVVNVSSVHAVATSIGIAAYATSKGALLALTRAMALEFAQDNIRVNAVLPGAVDTDMLRSGLMRGHLKVSNLKGLLGRLGRRHVMGRIGLPEEISEAILFLADGSRSSFVTGQALVVDGGATVRLSTE